jgi:hypothetical protein
MAAATKNSNVASEVDLPARAGVVFGTERSCKFVTLAELEKFIASAKRHGAGPRTQVRFVREAATGDLRLNVRVNR